MRPTEFLRPLLTDVKGRLRAELLPPVTPTPVKELSSVEEKWRSRKRKSSSYLSAKSAGKRFKGVICEWQKSADRRQ
jgi:hypothetical protein